MYTFKESRNTACIVCKHVLNKEKPILYISHDEDSMWQFLCEMKHEMEDARVISLQEAYKLDHSISQVANMPEGYCIEREDGKQKWK